MQKQPAYQKHVREAVEKAGSQSNLARLIGIRQSYISRLVNGTEPRISSDTAVKIERSLSFVGFASRVRPDLFRGPVA
jgi:DNA-binding transcriptional regulator YdaS (Cro superfamily)